MSMPNSDIFLFFAVCFHKILNRLLVAIKDFKSFRFLFAVCNLINYRNTFSHSAIELNSLLFRVLTGINGLEPLHRTFQVVKFVFLLFVFLFNFCLDRTRTYDIFLNREALYRSTTRQYFNVQFYQQNTCVTAFAVF